MHSTDLSRLAVDAQRFNVTGVETRSAQFDNRTDGKSVSIQRTSTALSMASTVP